MKRCFKHSTCKRMVRILCSVSLSLFCGSTLAQAPDAEALFTQRCAMCHDLGFSGANT